MKICLLTEEEYLALIGEVSQLRKDFEALRLQVIPAATPEAEEEVPPLIGAMSEASKVVPISEREETQDEVASQQTEEQQRAAEADAEHLRLNTKELAQ
jgi:hypothetical protein